MNPKQTDRRRFLKNGAALAGLAVGASAAALPAAAAAANRRWKKLTSCTSTASALISSPMCGTAASTIRSAG